MSGHSPTARSQSTGWYLVHIEDFHSATSNPIHYEQIPTVLCSQLMMWLLKYPKSALVAVTSLSLCRLNLDRHTVRVSRIMPRT